MLEKYQALKKECQDVKGDNGKLSAEVERLQKVCMPCVVSIADGALRS